MTNDTPTPQERLRRRANLATLQEASELLGLPLLKLQRAVARGALPLARAGCNRWAPPLVDLEDAEVCVVQVPTRGEEMAALLADGWSTEAVAERFGVLTRSAEKAAQRQHRAARVKEVCHG